MKRETDGDSGLRNAGAYCIAGCAVVAPQLLGGATGETQLGILLIANVAATIAAFSLRRDSSTGRAPLIAVASFAVSVWTFLQLLPAPCSAILRAYPERAELLRPLQELGALDELRCSITGSQQATRGALAFAATLASLLTSTTLLARSGHRTVLTRSVAVSSGVMAVVALLHAAFDAETVFGLYKPLHTKPGLLMAPLLNANHLAGHLALGFPLCISYAWSDKRLDARICWMVTAMLILLAGCLTLSRGGVGALVLGGSGWLALRSSRGTDRKAAPKTPRILLAIALAVLALAGAAGATVVADAFAQEGTSIDKLKLAAHLMATLTRNHPWLGIGRGSLVDASPSVVQGSSWAVHAENIVAQWTIEWGIPAALLLAAALAFSLLRSWPRHGDRFALLCGLVALGLQNLVDFSLEIAGVACPAAIALGVIVSKEHRLRSLRLPSLHRFTWLTTAAAVVTTLAAIPSLTHASRMRVRERVSKLLDVPGSSFGTELNAALTLYPLDPALMLHGAARAVRDDDPKATKWLALTMQAAPYWAAPHVQAAYWFERRGRLERAATELGLAADLDFEIAFPNACSFIDRHPSAQLARAAVTTGALREENSSRIAQCIGRSPVEAIKYADLLLAEGIDPLRAHILRARANAQLDELAQAVTEARTAVTRYGSKPEAWELLISMVAKQDPEAALASYASAPQAVKRQRDVLHAAGSAARYAKNQTVFKEIVELLITSSPSMRERGLAEIFAAEGLWKIGNPVAALPHARAAHEILGTSGSAAVLYRVATEAGVRPVALRAAAELCQLRFEGEAYCKLANP